MAIQVGDTVETNCKTYRYVVADICDGAVNDHKEYTGPHNLSFYPSELTIIAKAK